MLTIAAALTHSLLFTFAIYLATACAGITIGLVLFRRINRWVDARIERDVQAALDGASNWETDIAEAVALTMPPTHDTREQFVADAMAEIETLTGGEVA